MACKRILTMICIIIAATALGLNAEDTNKASTFAAIGNSAPELDVSEWIRGNPTTLQALRGKVVLLDFFQIICPGCRIAHVHIEEFQKRYEKHGLAVLGIAVAFEYLDSQKPDRIKAYVESKAFSYPVAIDRNMTKTFAKYHSRGTPWCVLIDRSGKVRYMGFFRDNQVESIIQKLLIEKPSQSK